MAKERHLSFWLRFVVSSMRIIGLFDFFNVSLFLSRENTRNEFRGRIKILVPLPPLIF